MYTFKVHVNVILLQLYHKRLSMFDDHFEICIPQPMIDIKYYISAINKMFVHFSKILFDIFDSCHTSYE